MGNILFVANWEDVNVRSQGGRIAHTNTITIVSTPFYLEVQALLKVITACEHTSLPATVTS